MKTTTNYGFKKPEPNDHYNVDDFNESFDSIDTELKNVSDKANTATEHLSDTNNPHKTTAAQVGLGNVPNVSTNDQTPSYTVASANTSLSSGEKLSVAFGKIAKAISSLISHLSDKNNPHGVTASQIGAVRQGGGAGQGTNTVAIGWAGQSGGLKATVDATDLGTLISTGNADGVVLPITKGGTGASSASAALTALGAVPASELSKHNFTNKTINSVNVDTTYNYNYVVAISEPGHGTVPTSDTSWVSIMNLYTDHFVTQLAFSCNGNAAEERVVKIWVRERYIGSSSVWAKWRLIYNDSLITFGTADLTAGTSKLDTGKIYLVYE